MHAIMRRMKTAVALTALAAMVAGFAVLAGCKAAPQALLSPPGKAKDSINDVVYLTGSFKNWDASKFVPSQSMELIDDYTWQETVTLPAGSIGFKFVIAVISGSWRAYTHPGQSGLTSSMTLVDGGIGNEVVTTIPTAGSWTFTFYEKGPHGTEGPTYTITQKTKYNGEIKGVVEFSDRSTSPLPSARVEARRGGAATDTQVVAVAFSDTLTGAYALTGLQDGAYSLKISGGGYADSIVTGITIAGENSVTVPHVKLPRAAFVGRWDRVVITGDFTSPQWTPDASATTMTLIDDGVWSIVLPAPATTINFKFTVNGAWGPSNYGAGAGYNNALVGPLDFAGNPANIAIPIPTAGNYRFTLHEKGYQGAETQPWYEIVPVASSAPRR